MTVLALEARDLRKSYGPTIALDGVSLAVKAGEVHALIGENGAGKSTLVKILSGIVRPDSGSVVVGAEPMPFGTVKAARAKGLRTAFQELSLVGDLTVTENFLLGEEPLGAGGLVRRREAERRVAGELERCGLGSIDPRRAVRDLDLPSRQKVEIARAISRDPAILLLDEPTASLSGHDVDWLGGLIRRLSGKGTAILFISHRMPEVREFCSRITILRNGRTAGDFDVHAVRDEEVIEAMIGRPLAATYPPKPSGAARGPAPALLSIRGLATRAGLADISLDLPKGQIVGIAGLEGMGQRDLFLALFGMAETVSGEIRDEAGPISIATPREAIGSKIGISLVPEDRKTEGLFLDFDGRQNATLPGIERYARFGLVSGKRQDEAATRVFQAVQVPDRALWSPVRVFSGGNQQKIVLAKWLLTGSRVLLLYDPTRGVDIGTKAEIYELMRRFVDEGGAILFYSTEIPELVHLCERVAVLYRGRIARQLEGEDITETAIMRATLGGAPAEGAQP